MGVVVLVYIEHVEWYCGISTRVRRDYSYPAFHRLRRPLRPLRGGVLRFLVSNLQSQNAARNSASSTCGPAPSCVVQGGHRGVLV